MTRTRPHAYLLLARVSNLPTVWTNVLAGLALAGGPLEWGWLLALSASLFYTGGMFLNDASDASFDARARPDRPIPSGDVSRREAMFSGAAFIAAGELLLAATPHPAAALGWGALLALAIVLYDVHHKGVSYGPILMGLCRALVYVVAAAAAAALATRVLLGAAAMWLYVMLLSVVAKRVGARAGAWVPWLLAGISLVDAAIIGVTVPGPLWLVAVAAFVLTRALQRVVPGT